jgi:PmbA protein
VRAFLENAVAATRVLEPEPERRQPEIERCGRGASEIALDANDPTRASLSVDARREAALELEAAVDALPERRRAISATIYMGDSAEESARVMTNGFEDVHRGTGFGLGAEMTLSDEGGRRPEAMAWYSANHRADLPSPAAVAAETWTRASQRLGSRAVASGRYPMLLQDYAVGRILGCLGAPLSGSELHQGRSFLAGKIGQSIAAAHFSLYDEPAIPRGLGSRPYDGEGIVARPMPIIESGVLRNYYVNTYYGRKLGMAPTTGGRSNWVVPAGTRSQAEILAGLDRAIVVTGFVGGNSNGLTGDFSFGINGLLVERGEVVANLSEMNVSGNIGELLHRFVEAADRPWTWSSCRSGSLLFGDVEFSGG